MATKAIFVYFTSVLLVQSVYSQCACGNSFLQPQILPSPVQVLPNTANIANSINLANSVNLGNNLALNNLNGAVLSSGLGVNNLALNNLNAGILNNGLGYTSAIAGPFEVVSGSPDYPGYPNGVSVTSVNDIGGLVAVAGGLPFAGSAYYDGSVASNGQAGLTYSSGQGLGLSASGCGYGLAGAGYSGLSGPILSPGLALPNVVSTGLSSGLNLGLASANTGLNLGLANANIINSGLNVGLGNANLANSGLNLAVANGNVINNGLSGFNCGGLLY